VPGPDPSRLAHSLSASSVRPPAPVGAVGAVGELAGGRYIVQGCMAEGGMGAVYRGWDAVQNRAVAIKVMKPGVTDPQDLARFSREAVAGRALDHPNIARVHAVGTAPGGAPFLVMDLIDGESLHERVRRTGPLEPTEAARLLARCARALEHAHGRGVLHRDLKPANVLVDRAGEPFLVDFGVVKLVGQGRLTATGEAVGTPNYMAPEQAHGDHHLIGPATDVYGLGATLHELLTGRPPFNGQSVLEVLERVISATPTPVRQLRPEVDPGLEAVVARCLAKPPEERFPTAGALALALEQQARGKARPGRADRRKRRAVRSAAAALVLVGVVAAAALGGALWSRRSAPSPGPAPTAEVVPAPPAPTATQAAPPPPAAELAPSAASSAAELAARGEALRADGQRAAAAEAFERALALDPVCVAALVGRGRVRFAARDLAGSRADLERAASLAPDDPAPLAYLARTLQNLKDLEGALRVVERSLAIGRHPEAYATRAGIAVGRADFRAAVPDYAAACELAPRDANYANSLGTALQLSGDLEGAVRAYGRALDIDPRWADSLENRARCLQALGRQEEAARDTDRLIEVKPGADPLCVRATRRAQGGDLAGAQADVTRALELAPGFPRALGLRGGLKAAAGDLAGARADLDAALAGPDPARGELLEVRGGIRLAAGDREGAARDWAEAIDWLERAGDPRRAQPLRQRLRRLEAGDAER
jgi:tetratricopeptide (TPR) repeat protein